MFSAIGPMRFGAGSPWPVDPVPARAPVAASYTTALATPLRIRSTRLRTTPSKSIGPGSPDGSAPSSQIETLSPITCLPSSMNERPSSSARPLKPMYERYSMSPATAYSSRMTSYSPASSSSAPRMRSPFSAASAPIASASISPMSPAPACA